jgi:hypothetical protein
MRNRVQLVCLLLMLLVVTGCATTSQNVPFPSQSVAIENPAMARIYVVRPASVGGAVKMMVLDGQKAIGKTGPNSYLCWEREAGTTEIVSEAENTSKLPLTVDAGKAYYIKQALRMGLVMARCKLELLSEDVGRSLVKKCKPPKTEEKAEKKQEKQQKK